MSRAEEKVPGGKLLCVSVSDGRVEISGDFFAHPEGGVELIENVLSRLDGARPAAEIEQVLTDAIEAAQVELIGIDVPVIVRLYRRCLACGE